MPLPDEQYFTLTRRSTSSETILNNEIEIDFSSSSDALVSKKIERNPFFDNPLVRALISRNGQNADEASSRMTSDELSSLLSSMPEIAHDNAPVLPLLSLAAASDARKTISALIKSGADVSQFFGNSGWQPLHFVSSVEAFELLVDAGANPRAFSNSGVSVLTSACTKGNVALVEKILSLGVDPNEPPSSPGAWHPALAAAGHEADAILALLAKKGADLRKSSSNGMTPLHQAARKGSLACATLLIEAEVPLDAKGPEGMTPLHLAVKENKSDMALLLVSSGADPLSVNDNGCVPSDYAAKGFPVELPEAPSVSPRRAIKAKKEKNAESAETGSEASARKSRPSAKKGAVKKMPSAKNISAESETVEPSVRKKRSSSPK